MLDSFGSMMFEATAFLIHLVDMGYPKITVNQYGRQLRDICHVFLLYDGGKDSISQMNDAFLRNWHTECVGPKALGYRGIRVATFHPRASLLFRMLQWLQDNKWISDVIGYRRDGDSPFPISIPEEGIRGHEIMTGTPEDTLPDIPTNADFDLIEAEMENLVKSPVLRRRNRNLCESYRDSTLRRKEAIELKISDLPSKKWLEKYRSKASPLKGLPSPIVVKVDRAKGGGRKKTYWTLSKLDELWKYIDFDRPIILNGRPDNDFVFISTKTGKGLTPQYFTNIFKLAAHAAARAHKSNRGLADIDLNTVRPHHYRHRSITDLIVGLVEGGESPKRAIIEAAELAGISIETAERYMHISEAGSPSEARDVYYVKRDEAASIRIERSLYGRGARRKTRGPRKHG